MWASPGVGGGEAPADGQVGQSGRRGAGLTLSVRLGLWELPPGRHVLDHPRLRGSVLLWLRQRVPLHVFQVSPARAAALGHAGSGGRAVERAGLRVGSCYVWLSRVLSESSVFCYFE